MKILTTLIPLLPLIVITWTPNEVKAGAWWDAIATGTSTCGQPGYFVNPGDCTKFYRCVDHSTSEGPLLVRYDFDCPPGTVFSQGKKVCVHPREGGSCGGWSAPPTPGWTAPAPAKEGWGWSPPSGGWSPPSGGWSPPGGWYHVHDGWGWGHPGYSFWSFTPKNSYVIIYDSHGKKRSVQAASAEFD